MENGDFGNKIFKQGDGGTVFVVYRKYLHCVPKCKATRVRTAVMHNVPLAVRRAESWSQIRIPSCDKTKSGLFL